SYDAPWVDASGPFASDLPTSPASSKKGAPLATDTLQATLDGSGWYLIGIGAPNQVADAMKSLSVGISRPKIQALMRSTLTTLGSSSETAQLVKAGSPVLTMKPMPAPKELGKGSLDFEVTLARDVLSGS